MNRITKRHGGKQKKNGETYEAVQDTRAIRNAATDMPKQMETWKRTKAKKQTQTTGKGLPRCTKRKSGGRTMEWRNSSWEKQTDEVEQRKTGQ